MSSELERLADRAIAAQFGDEAVKESRQQRRVSERARAKLDAKRAEAERINRRARPDEVGDLEADSQPQRPIRQKVVSRARYQKQAREAGKLSRLLRRRVRDNGRAEADAAALAEEALRTHGIRHHYRPLPKLAFFAAYMAGVSLDRSLCLRAFAMLNVPADRAAAVMEAAFEPTGWSPIRDVCRGSREDQQGYTFDGRALDGRQWTDGQRDEDHPGAIRVLQVFIFLWLTRTRTPRKGFSYVVRGFGRGLYASICRSSHHAITGHEKGVPGALLALRLSGAIQYRQPKQDPLRPLSPMDKGRTGHAYNAIWFVSSPEEKALEQLHERLRGLTRVVALEPLLAEPSLIEPLARPPPRTFTDADIPF